MGGIGLTMVLGLAYFIATMGYAANNQAPAYTVLLLEAFKTLLTFSLITTGGIALKTFIDQVLEKERNNQTETNRYEETRKLILKEFATIFSEFYSVRKLYHSAISHEALYKKNSTELNLLLRHVLQKSVDLEGRFGALKISAITHFNLPRSEYAKKKVECLLANISSTVDQGQKLRYRLDLLGECYDDWRHAVEEQRKIKVDKEFYTSYDLLLTFFENTAKHGKSCTTN